MPNTRTALSMKQLLHAEVEQSGHRHTDGIHSIERQAAAKGHQRRRRRFYFLQISDYFLRSLSGRLLPHTTPDDDVGDAVIHAAEVDEEHADDQQPRRRNVDHRPDIVEDHRPPLDEKDDNEEHHHLGRVIVALHVGAHQLGGTADRHPDATVCQSYSDEDEQFKDGEEPTVIPTSFGSYVDGAPVIIRRQTKIIII